MNKFVESNANADRFTTLNTIGKDVAYHTGDFDYTTGSIEVGYSLDGVASEVNLSLQLNGATIATFKGTELGKGNHFFTWDGLTKDGDQAGSGNYKIVLQAKAANGESIGVAPLIKSEVTGVDLESESGTILITKAGEVAFSSILGVYEVGNPSLVVERDEEEPEDDTSSLQNNLDTAADIANDINNIVE
jgi:flagellar basal-body rod modification protein FlgD